MRKLLPGMDNGCIFRPSIKSKIKVMKKQFIIIPFNDVEGYCIVEDVKGFIAGLFGEYTDKTEDSFYRFHKVFEITGEIKEMN